MTQKNPARCYARRRNPDESYRAQNLINAFGNAYNRCDVARMRQLRDMYRSEISQNDAVALKMQSLISVSSRPRYNPGGVWVILRYMDGSFGNSGPYDDSMAKRVATMLSNRGEEVIGFTRDANKFIRDVRSGKIKIPAAAAVTAKNPRVVKGQCYTWHTTTSVDTRVPVIGVAPLDDHHGDVMLEEDWEGFPGNINRKGSKITVYSDTLDPLPNPRRWPQPSAVQSLIFDKHWFPHARACKAWARKHGFRYGKVDEKANTYRLRQFDPDQVSRFATIALREGVKAVIGA